MAFVVFTFIGTYFFHFLYFLRGGFLSFLGFCGVVAKGSKKGKHQLLKKTAFSNA